MKKNIVRLLILMLTISFCIPTAQIDAQQTSSWSTEDILHGVAIASAAIVATAGAIILGKTAYNCYSYRKTKQLFLVEIPEFCNKIRQEFLHNNIAALLRSPEIINDIISFNSYENPYRQLVKEQIMRFEELLAKIKDYTNQVHIYRDNKSPSDELFDYTTNLLVMLKECYIEIAHYHTLLLRARMITAITDQLAAVVASCHAVEQRYEQELHNLDKSKQLEQILGYQDNLKNYYDQIATAITCINDHQKVVARYCAEIAPVIQEYAHLISSETLADQYKSLFIKLEKFQHDIQSLLLALTMVQQAITNHPRYGYDKNCFFAKKIDALEQENRTLTQKIWSLELEKNALRSQIASLESTIYNLQAYLATKPQKIIITPIQKPFANSACFDHDDDDDCCNEDDQE